MANELRNPANGATLTCRNAYSAPGVVMLCKFGASVSGTKCKNNCDLPLQGNVRLHAPSLLAMVAEGQSIAGRRIADPLA